MLMLLQQFLLKVQRLSVIALPTFSNKSGKRFNTLGILFVC